MGRRQHYVDKEKSACGMPFNEGKRIYVKFDTHMINKQSTRGCIVNIKHAITILYHYQQPSSALCHGRAINVDICLRHMQEHWIEPLIILKTNSYILTCNAKNHILCDVFCSTPSMVHVVFLILVSFVEYRRHFAFGPYWCHNDDKYEFG